MATYFHGNTSEIESSAEGLQTLYLMNPNYVPYSHAPNNMLLVNPNTSIAAGTTPANALNLANFSHAPPLQSPNNHHQQHLVGFTIPSSNTLGCSTTTTTATRDSTQLGHRGHSISGIQSFAATDGSIAANPRSQYNLWGSIINQTMSSATTGAETTQSNNNSGYSAAVTVSDDSEIGYYNGGQRQGSLSLTLSSQQPSFRPLSGEINVPLSRGTGNNGVVLGSRYLKAAQEVLDEAVNMGEGISKGESMNGDKEKIRGNIESTTSGIGDGGENSGSKQGAELSTAQRQELQMKKSKLVNMLDEVELRYRQYHHQMEMLISSFEQAAGYGAAKAYTALASKTISKQFRCLKDSISSQIKTTSKTLGDQDDCLGAKVEGSRLRFVDHHLRQQRALQQLGMIQHNAWRPQRGLPERAVSVLRAWLFEHFLHPYPKDSDKVMLAKQTGLTRSQVSNWFINARVRLWKPMVEEMYLEELKEQEQNNDNSTNRAKESSKELWSASATNNAAEKSSGAIKLDHQINALHTKPERFNNRNTSPTEISNSDNNSLSTSPMGGGSFQSHSGFHLAESSSEIQIRSPKKPRSSEMHLEMEPVGDKTREANTEFDTERHNRGGYPLMTGGNENHGGGYNGGGFSMEDIGRFNVTEQLAPRFHGNGVSLTLGLPHNENLPLSETQHGFLSQNMHLGGRLEMRTNENEFCGINNTPPSSHSSTGYENIDIQNRKRYAAQLLRNFVA